MKVVLLGSFYVCGSLYETLFQHQYLNAVCFEESNVIESGYNYLDSMQQLGLDTFIINNENIADQFTNWLEAQAPDLVLVCGFSLKIAKKTLSIPTYGFLNIHFGKLPENRGPDPLFQSIKKGEKQTAITIHQMDEDWDTGDIVLEQPVPIIAGETMGMLNSKMIYKLKDLSVKAIECIKNQANLIPQSTEKPAGYYKRPSSFEITIRWEIQTADEIENLINSCNPKYGGATTYYQGAPIKILEISPVDSPTPLFGRTPGEIIHAHPQEGLFVCCKYGQLIRINTISSDAGILSGTKYVNLGIQQGQCFTSKIKTEHMLLKDENS